MLCFFSFLDIMETHMEEEAMDMACDPLLMECHHNPLQLIQAIIMDPYLLPFTHHHHNLCHQALANILLIHMAHMDMPTLGEGEAMIGMTNIILVITNQKIKDCILN